MKRTIGTVAVFAVIAPNALLAAQVAQATPDDPTTTTTVAPTPTQQAPPISTQTVPASTAPPVTQAPVQTYEPPVTAYTPPAQAPARTVPAHTPAVAPTNENPVIVPAPRTAIDTTVPPTALAPVITTQPPTTQGASTTVSVPSATATTSTPAPAATTPASAAVTTGAVVPANPTPSSNPTSGVLLPTESGASNTPQSSSAAVSTTLTTTAIVTGGTTVTAVVPSTSSSLAVTSANQLVVPQPSGVAVKDAAVIEAAKVAPAVVVDPAAPPPPPVNVTNVTNINTQITNIQQVNIQNNTNITVNTWRPDRWDYVDYDEYRRPIFYNPSEEDVRYRYYYDGDYREVWVPAGARTVLNIGIVGVFPFVAVGASFVSSGFFNGGAWIPPYDGYVGPPPPEWHPYQPVYYDNASVNVAAANQSIFVNRVTVVGHDDTLPAGQQDSFMLDGTTLARGQISPDGTAITLATAQKTPGVGPVTDGVDLVNLAQPIASTRDNTPYYVSAALALAALMGGVFWWVWHKRPGHAASGYDPPTGPLT